MLPMFTGAAEHAYCLPVLAMKLTMLHDWQTGRERRNPRRRCRCSKPRKQPRVVHFPSPSLSKRLNAEMGAGSLVVVSARKAACLRGHVRQSAVPSDVVGG